MFQEKGMFPYLFNTRSNQDYVGPIPNISYYGFENMKSEAQKELLKWWTEKSLDPEYVFDMRKEILQYCKASNYFHSDSDQ